MAIPAEKALSPEQLKAASSNYLRCLNLPPSSQVLIITDKPNGVTSDDNFLTRTYLTSSLGRQISREGHRVATINYDNSLSFEDFRAQTNQVLNELDNKEGVEGFIDDTTTIVYLGEKWKDRFGIYEAAEDFGKKHNRTVRFAGSLGFSTGDARVMSELTPKKMDKIDEENKKFHEFFEKKPLGKFEITTRGKDGQERILNISYNTKEAPFEPDTGQFDEANNNLLSEHVKYINIPGGETFAAPYPFQKTNGEFAAEGMLVTVKDGLVLSIVELEEGARNNKDPMQKELIKLVEEGKKIPVAELGLGYYALIGIKTYPDSSILSREKGGPHIGFAHTYTTTEKKAIEHVLEDQGLDFGHTDFVMDDPVMVWTDVNGGNQEQFYPPVQQLI